MSDPSFDERTRVSGPGLRTFLNIADRWKLPESDRLALLQCDPSRFADWSRIARLNGPLVLETAVFMRLSAILGVFAELQQLLSSADQERDWLTRAHKSQPFNGLAPCELLRGALEDLLAVRRYVYGLRCGGVPPNEIDREFTPYTDQYLIWHRAAPQIQAVCFDGFGTLVEIGDKRRPFRTLLGDAPTSAAVTRALTTPTSLRDFARHLAIVLDETRLAELQADLEAECASTRPRPGIDALWEKLRRLGLRVGVCSNLAAPYEDALIGCLPRAPDALVLSFEVGLMKPQAEIYRLVCRQLNLEPDQVLFVGDSLQADILGPQAAGLFGMHIDAFETSLAPGAVPAAPRAIAELFERMGGLGQGARVDLTLSPDEALDSALASVNASTRLGYKRDELLYVLRAPTKVRKGDNPALKLLLGTFFDETEEALLARISEGTEITWANLAQAVQAGLQPSHPKRAWIISRAIRSGALRR